MNFIKYWAQSNFYPAKSSPIKLILYYSVKCSVVDPLKKTFKISVSVILFKLTLSLHYPILILAGGAGSAPLGSPPADGMNGQLSYIAGNASEVGNQYGRGGIAESKMTSSGMRGVSGTGGGAGYYGIADSPVELTSADKSYPAIGFEPFVEKHQFLNESEKVEYAPLTGGRWHGN